MRKQSAPFLPHPSSLLMTHFHWHPTRVPCSQGLQDPPLPLLASLCDNLASLHPLIDTISCLTIPKPDMCVPQAGTIRQVGRLSLLRRAQIPLPWASVLSDFLPGPWPGCLPPLLFPSPVSPSSMPQPPTLMSI